MYSVADFASQKGISVSRVRQLVAAGDIPSERVGNLVVIPARAAGWRPRSRRPLSDRMAAALLDALSGSLPEVSPKELSRVRAHLVLMHSSPHPAVVLSDLLASRSRRQSFSAHPDDLKDLKSDKRLKLSGASLPEFQLSPGSSLDAYVAPVDIEGVVREYMLRPEPGGAVALRAQAVSSEHLVALGAADLAEMRGGRELREADRVVRELAEQAL